MRVKRSRQEVMNEIQVNGTHAVREDTFHGFIAIN